MNVKYSIGFLLFLWVLAGTACYDDKGSYDYQPVQETYVASGIKISYQKAIGEILEIIPTIVNGGDNLGDTSRYEYRWTAQREIEREGEDNTLHVIGHGLSLYYRVELPKLSHEDHYLVTLHMKDRVTGIDWTKTTLLTVTGDFPEGWLLLRDEGGKAELDIYAQKSDGSMMLVKDLLKYSGNPYLNGPRKVVYEDATGDSDNVIWILTDAGTFYIDKKDYFWDETRMMKYIMVEIAGNDYTCEDLASIAFGTKTFQIMEDGGGVQCRVITSKGGIYQGNVAAYQDGTRFSVAPYFGHGQKRNPMFSSVLLYDTDHQQFVSCGGAMGESPKFCTAMTPESDWKIGKKMLYMQHAALNYTYALFGEEGSNDILQCKINFGMGFNPSTGAMGASITMGLKETLTGATHLKNARLRIYHSTTGHLYYVDGNTLYTWYDGHEQPLQTFTEEVTALHSQLTYATDTDAQKIQSYLLVATYAPRQDIEQDKWGTLYFYTVDQATPVNIREANRVTGVGKVIDIDYQEK